MRRIVIKVPDSEYRSFMKLVKGFSFVEIDEKKSKLLEAEAKLSFSKLKIWNSIKEGISEVELIQNGHLKAKTADDFLNEI
jgi:hypothetical protein